MFTWLLLLPFFFFFVNSLRNDAIVWNIWNIVESNVEISQSQQRVLEVLFIRSGMQCCSPFLWTAELKERQNLG